MLLTITSSHQPATDLGYLLHKNPSRLHSFELSFGKAHVFYPETRVDRCTAALLLDVDPVGLVRNRKGSSEGGLLDQYVNDRPYVASSFMSVAMGKAFGTAMTGRSKERQELADTAIPLLATVSVVACRPGEGFLRSLFEPLGYTVGVTRHPLDPRFPEWGESPYYKVTIASNVRLWEMLAHLYVLIPVLDDEKHYWVGDAEVEKLLRFGEGWLAKHPEREVITRRYLRHWRRLTREALARLVAEEQPDPEAEQEQHATEEEQIEKPISLHKLRLEQVTQALAASGAKRVLDLGCGEGKLIRHLLKNRQFSRITGMDVSFRSLQTAAERLELERMPSVQRERIYLFQGALNYRDQRLAGHDAAAVVEVIEHLDEARLAAFERVLFEFAKPPLVVITTPNREYNVKFPTLPAGKMRHRDHRFEWTRQEFQSWGAGVGQRFGYSVEFLPVGPVDEVVGAPSQMGVFRK
jgi:3' terminal RNA ribose 2'-O-methyltransferase Hen1